MNRFERDLDNLPYSTDWTKMRNNVCQLVQNYINTRKVDWWHQYQKTAGDELINFIAFHFDYNVYLLVDYRKFGKIAGCQVEKLYDDSSIVLYSAHVNSGPIGQSFMYWVEQNDITKIR